MRPVTLMVLCPMFTASEPSTTYWSGGTAAVTGTSPRLVWRSTPPFGAEFGSQAASPEFTRVGVIWHTAPGGIGTCELFSTVTVRLGQTI